MEQEQDKNKKTIKIPGWAAVGGVCLFFIIVLIILYLTFVRYNLLAKSINHSDVTTSAMLLSPEIAFGLAQLI